MALKIYSYQFQTSFVLKQFKEFDVIQISNEECVISLGLKKMSVVCGQVFEINERHYFVFDELEINFILK